MLSPKSPTKKVVVLASSLFATSASAANLRSPHHRSLTNCPATDLVKLKCDILDNAGKVVAALGEDDAGFEFGESTPYDPEACYDIKCTADGLTGTNANADKYVKFIFADTVHESWPQVPEYGAKAGSCATNSFGSCEDMNVVIQAWQNPDNASIARGDTTIEDYMCEEKIITCEDNTTEPPTEPPTTEPPTKEPPTKEPPTKEPCTKDGGSKSKNNDKDYSKGTKSNGESKSNDDSKDYSKGTKESDTKSYGESKSNDDSKDYSKGTKDSDTKSDGESKSNDDSKDYSKGTKSNGESKSNDDSKDDTKGTKDSDTKSDGDSKSNKYSKGSKESATKSYGGDSKSDDKGKDCNKAGSNTKSGNTKSH